MIIKHQHSYCKSIIMLFVIAIGLFRCDLAVVTTEPLSNPYRTKHFIIYYDTSVLTATQIEYIGAERERLLDHVNRYLNTTYNRTIEIFISDTLTGAGADASIYEQIRETTSYTFWDHGHEIAHIISFQEWGYAGFGFLMEGVATAASEYKKYSIIDTYKGDLELLIRNNQSDLETEMTKLVDKLSSGEWSGSLYTYNQAGAFIQFLNDTYGLQKVNQWYQASMRSRQMADEFYDVFGIGCPQAVNMFKAMLIQL